METGYSKAVTTFLLFLTSPLGPVALALVSIFLFADMTLVPVWFPPPPLSTPEPSSITFPITFGSTNMLLASWTCPRIYQHVNRSIKMYQGLLGRSEAEMLGGSGGTEPPQDKITYYHILSYTIIYYHIFSYGIRWRCYCICMSYKNSEARGTVHPQVLLCHGCGIVVLVNGWGVVIVPLLLQDRTICAVLGSKSLLHLHGAQTPIFGPHRVRLGVRVRLRRRAVRGGLRATPV